MAKVILLCGKIASGKTTYAQALRAKNGAVILSCDELMLTLYDHCLGDKHDETVARCSKYLNKLALQLIENGTDVILDFGYWKKSERETVRAFFTAHSIPVELYYLVCSEQTRISRLEYRNQALAGATERVYLIGEALRERLDQKFEEPTREETDVIVNTEEGGF